MSWRAHLDSLKRDLFHRDRLEADLDEELRSYVELLTQEKVRGGMEPGQARREALLEVGGVEQVLGNEVARPRFHTVLVGAFAALAQLLALVGVYGIISYGVVLRRHEIGLRMALGAQRTDVGRLIVWRGLAAPCIGIGLGLAGALAVTPLLRSFLFSVEPNDPATYAFVASVTLAVVVAASVIPAVRAMRIDPMAMLRHD